MPKGYTLFDAGIVDDNNKLTKDAKNIFIKDIKEILTLGSNKASASKIFSFGPVIEPNPNAKFLMLEDEKQFSDFHKNIFGLYEKIAVSFNVQSNFSLLPVCCPVALANKLGVDIKIEKFPNDFIPFLMPNLPGLAVKMNMMPPSQLASKIPTLIKIPNIPTFNLDLPKVPDFKDLFTMNISFVNNMPKFMSTLITQAPSLALKLTNFPTVLSSIADIALESNLFGKMSPTSNVQIAITQVLIRRVIEFSCIDMIGLTLGSAAGGLTGCIGTFFGYASLVTNDTNKSASNASNNVQNNIVSNDKTIKIQQDNVRDKIVKYALECKDFSWSNSDKDRDDYVKRLFPIESANIKDVRSIGYEATRNFCSSISSSGTFAKACLMAGGASCVLKYRNSDVSKFSTQPDLWYDFFNDSYRKFNDQGLNLSGIITAANIKNSFISPPRSIIKKLPLMKKGDLIVVYHPYFFGKEHIMLLVEDNTSTVIKTIEGGQIDKNNKNLPTSIQRKEYKIDFEKSTGEILINKRKILCIIDAEKICTNINIDFSNPIGNIDLIACDNNNENDKTQYLV